MLDVEVGALNEEVSNLGRHPTADVHTGEFAVLVADEEPAHALGRPVGDDVLAAVAGHQGQWEGGLLVGGSVVLGGRQRSKVCGFISTSRSSPPP